MTTSAVSRAAAVLCAGGLVAFPTETVYGLGADARNSAAVRRIFAAKGRPNTNPLIVHVADESIARRYAAAWPEAARKLAAAFWPGPLTLVLPKTGAIVPEVTAGRDTLGLRVPSHPLALELLRAFDGPLAGPSANRSTKVSPTTAEHVRKELGDRVDLILDGGPCRVGIESTVLDLSHALPVILRPGSVSRAQIEALIGPVSVFAGALPEHVAAMGPGMNAVHYSPSTPTYRFEAGNGAPVEAWCRANAGGRAVVLIIPSLIEGAIVRGWNDREWVQPIGAKPSPPGDVTSTEAGERTAEMLKRVAAIGHYVVAMPSEPRAYAGKLYAALHDADERGAAAIWVQAPPDDPEWAAVRDRILRASNPVE